MGWSRDVGECTTDTVAGKIAVATESLSARNPDGSPTVHCHEAHLADVALEAARAAVIKFGGKARVWIGGHRRPLDSEGPEFTDVVQNSITVTVTTVEKRT